jgi:hypothetical protein
VAFNSASVGEADVAVVVGGTVVVEVEADVDVAVVDVVVEVVEDLELEVVLGAAVVLSQLLSTRTTRPTQSSSRAT